jgi:L-ascorbate metabolism protein UlaG (beta-lactamase superfamily)
MYKAKIHYLYHDGFLLETKYHILIFDYYDDSCSIISEDVLKSEKEIYVFVSHSHGDHFNPVIFKWIDINPKIKYILSSDIKPKDIYPENKMISEGEIIEFNDIFIKAFGSTDVGISFLVKTDGISIFHAGDLNLWHWKDESDEYNVQMSKDYKSKVNKIIGNDIDIAFFPVDPRLEEYCYLGGEYFIEKLSPKLFIPMHFWDKNETTQDFAEKLRSSDSKIAVIKKRGQEILF